MARKTDVLETLALLGGAAAATALVYWKRKEIRAFVEKATEELFGEEKEFETFDAEETPEETDIVIDVTALEEPEEAEEAAEDAEEEKAGE